MSLIFRTLALILLCYSAAATAYANQSFDGRIELQHRQFFEEMSPGQIKGQTSGALTLEFLQDWNKGNDRLEIEAFWRLDEADNERSHVDIRQFLWTHFGDDYEFSAGVGRVFWGVTETQHLVDIVNQTDLVENIDGEDKLGQPMLRYQRFGDWGSVEAFILPYFRRRTFEGVDGRLNAGLDIDADNPIYQSSSGSSHIDFALRYANTFGPIDLGLSWFSGTSREPDLFVGLETVNPINSTLEQTINGSNLASGALQPFYSQLDQFGADIQLTQGGWLFKLEAVQRNFDSDQQFARPDYAAATVGFEYTLVGILGTTYDLGLLSEYSWDERDEGASSVFQNDVFIGARLALNDIADSQFLFGLSEDLDFSGSQSVFLEGSTRINNHTSFNVEARYFAADNVTDPLFALRDSSFVQLSLEFFFD